jgi:hypothetical protein
MHMSTSRHIKGLAASRSALSEALRSLETTRAQLAPPQDAPSPATPDPHQGLREWRAAAIERKIALMIAKAKVQLTPAERGGFDYQVLQDGARLCDGWAAGTESQARGEAIEHASRTLRVREQIRAAAITGEPASGDR